MDAHSYILTNFAQGCSLLFYFFQTFFINLKQAWENNSKSDSIISSDGTIKLLSSSVLDGFGSQSIRSLLRKEFSAHHSLLKLFIVNLIYYSDIYPNSLFTLVLQISELVIHTKKHQSRYTVVTYKNGQKCFRQNFLHSLIFYDFYKVGFACTKMGMIFTESL